jgi:hypothetical protein
MTTKIIFRKVIQDGLEFGSNETRAVSRVFFDLEAAGKTHTDLYVDLEEPVSATHETAEISVGAFSSPVELGRAGFEEAVRSYYQSLVSSAGYGKHLAKDKGFRSHGDELGLVQVVEL